MEIIKKKSLLISLITYFMVGMLLSELVYYGASMYVDCEIRNLMNPRPTYVSFERGNVITLYEQTEDIPDSTEILNPRLFEMLQQVQKVLPVFIFGVGVLITAYIFYRKKLKTKFELLKKATEEIGKQHLDFSTECRENDELGALCNSFESMRKELKKAFQQLWEEEEKNDELFSAFAHDLRTPLTILKGNNEVLYYLLSPDEKNDNELKTTLEASENAIHRIEVYTKALKEIKDIEQWEPDFTDIELEHLVCILEKQCDILSKKYKKAVKICCNQSALLHVEMTWLQLILDKLLENAFRFAASEVILTIEAGEKTIRFMVWDDGAGFSTESIKKAKEMFYSVDKARGHSGIGLAVAEKLLKRYRSGLVIENCEDKGAKVSFCIEFV